MRILAIGDIVGRPGRAFVAQQLGELAEREGIDFVVVNAENAAGGAGLTAEIADSLFAAGAAVVTTGDHVWRRQKIAEKLAADPRLLRPHNFAPEAPGTGCGIFEAPGGIPVAVVNIQGRVFMHPIDCPFHAMDRALEQIGDAAKIILVDFHAEATSEKIAMGRSLDGRVTAVFGTHTHVQTADETIWPGGTAYITDLGMSGPHESILGRNTENVIKHFRSWLPFPFDVAKDDIRLSGVIIDADESTGKATAIRRIQVRKEVAS